MKEVYCHDCFNSGWDLDLELGWVGCHCGRCEDEEGKLTIKPTLNCYLTLLVKNAMVKAFREIGESINDYQKNTERH